MQTNTTIQKTRKRSKEQVIRQKMKVEPCLEATCTGKVAYDRHGATRAIAAMKARGREERAYECPYCGSWHVESGLKPRVNRPRRRK